MSGPRANSSALVRGRYEPLEVVGSGAQGRVVKAVDHVHGRLVALKVRAARGEADRGALLSEHGSSVTDHRARRHIPVTDGQVTALATTYRKTCSMA